MPRSDQYPNGGALEATDIFVVERAAVGTVQILGDEIVNPAAPFIFPPLAAAPSSPTVGMAYYDTTLGYPLIYGSDNLWHGFLLS